MVWSYLNKIDIYEILIQSDENIFKVGTPIQHTIFLSNIKHCSTYLTGEKNTFSKWTLYVMSRLAPCKMTPRVSSTNVC